MGVGVAAGETPSLTGEVLGDTNRGLGVHKPTHSGTSTRGAQFDCG